MSESFFMSYNPVWMFYCMVFLIVFLAEVHWYILNTIIIEKLVVELVCVIVRNFSFLAMFPF